MARRETFHDKRGREARALFDQGLSCNVIAKKLGVGAATVSRWAKAEGLSFAGRARARTAHEVRGFDMAAARVRLARKMTSNADRALDSLDRPFLVYSFGGKDNSYSEHTFEEAPLAARREAQTIGAMAFDKVTKAIEGTGGADSLAPVESMLGRLAIRFELADA